MTKTKSELRAEAVARLREYHDWEPSEKSLANLTLPLWPTSMGMSNDQRIDALIDLLTDDPGDEIHKSVDSQADYCKKPAKNDAKCNESCASLPEGNAVEYLRAAAANGHSLRTLRESLGITNERGWLVRCFTALADMVERDYVRRDAIRRAHPRAAGGGRMNRGLDMLRDYIEHDTLCMKRRSISEIEDVLAREMGQLEAKRDEAREDADRWRLQFNEAEAENIELRTRIVELEAERNVLRAEVASLRRAAKRDADHLESITNSLNDAEAERDEWRARAGQVPDGCVELPKDADGEYVHFGDTLITDPEHGHGESFEVDGIGPRNTVFHTQGHLLNGWNRFNAGLCLVQHHKPTLEDVVEKALNKAAQLDRNEGYWPSAADVTNITNDLCGRIRELLGVGE